MRINLKKGREKSLLRRHPWVFSGAVDSIDGEGIPGETAAIHDSAGKFLAWGAFSPTSQIWARVWTWDEDEKINAAFFRRRIIAANNLREKHLNLNKTTAYRLVHAESDKIPGLVVDRYDDVLAVQFLSVGVEFYRDIILNSLMEIFTPSCIVERSDAAVRELEGLPMRSGIVFGGFSKEPGVTILENELRFNVQLLEGQKTGFYLDQRDNRQLSQKFSKGCTVLDGFSFTGGFTVNALAGGAKSVLSIDASADAIKLAKENVQLNRLPVEKCTWIVGDMFKELRTLRDKGASFDLVILDPPKFAPTAALAKQAARGYKDINRLGFKLIKPGGILMTFSCSGGVDMSLFQKIVADAALDARVDSKIIQRLGQAVDHPTLLAFPEGTYLKGLVCQVEG
jgi:23S rRNA (cytosine1962-C5)-methyltransferase